MNIRVGIPTLLVVLMFLVMNSEIWCQLILPPTPPPPPSQPSPLCMSQFVLANHACGQLPFTQISPPSRPSPRPPSPPNSPPPRRRRRHSHRHSSHPGTPVEQECCRWLKEIDNDCVCNMVVHLPAFLTKPIHAYTVMVGSSCRLSYTCSGRMMSV